MKIYLVGGAVRDQLLGLPIKEKDWVVVGATVDEMLKKGFRPVGKDFPVFLHPKTNEEYALARTERKVGRGYTGFHFDTSPHVSLEEDLRRRDLTINAIAETPSGEFIDPYHGREDIQKKVLRHVSTAFAEDPVRILRIARFAARFYEIGFTVAEDTNELMKKMVLSGEVDALVAERVWKEWERALAEKNPEQFFQVLADCDALPVLFPELGIDTAGMQALIFAAQQSLDTTIRFAALLHDRDVSHINLLCARYRVPGEYRALALLVSQYLNDFQKVEYLSAEGILDLLQNVDAFRREDRLKQFLKACEVSAVCSPAWLWQCYIIAKKMDVTAWVSSGMIGKEIAEKLRQARIEKIQDLISLRHPKDRC